MPQKHDNGWKKRNRDTPARATAIDAYSLARKLVDKDLAPAVILGPMKAYYIKDDK
jgi:hypothetical protein